uniref:Uncharacterized protein LOC116292321 isoform X2 n=1 Tax=Actinia tenebrosa TaxID=6105 RepID=A0A6P8HHZ0_ACTTE
MRLLASFLALLAFILTGFSWKCLVYYSVFALASWWLIYLFLCSKYELDFDVVFKVLEWVGYGSPHFLENKSCLSSSENTTDGQTALCRIPEPISKRIDVVVQNVSRDFVGSWYREVAEGDVFIEESKAALQKLSVDIYNRMSNLDSHLLSEQVIMVFHAHLERFNKAVSVLKDKDPNLKLAITSSQLLHQTYESQIPSKHLALKNPTSELNYLRTVVDSLLAALLPENIFSCDMGRFILREILAVQLVDLVDMLSDAEWVNEAIIDLLSPPREQLSDVLTDQKLHDQETSDKANKDGLKSIGNSTGINPSGIYKNIENILPEGEEENVISSFERQVRIFPAEGQETTDLAIIDDRIKIKDTEDSLVRNNQQLDNSDSMFNENVKTFDSGNGNLISPEDSEKDLEGCNRPSLSSSWGYLPSSGDKTFQTQSFEAMKQEAIERERLKNSSKKIVDFVGTCCTRFEASDELDGNLKNKFAQMRKRTASLPEDLDVMTNGIDKQNKMCVSNGSRSFQRSVSFPNNMSSVLERDETLDPVERPLRSSTIHPTPVYGSPYYNISFCSSDGSFKSFSDDDMEVEEGEEMDEGNDSDDDEISEDIAPLPIMKAPPRGAISREIDNEGNNMNGDGDVYQHNIRQRKHGFAKRSEFMQDRYKGNGEITGSTEDTSNGKNSFDSFRDNRYSSKDSDSSDPRSPMETTPPKPRMLESDPSFSDSVILAGRKFISSIKSPVKNFGFSSGSSKSTSISSGADSMEVNVPSSIDSASFDSDLPFHRPVLKTKTDSPSSGRKLSRSQAVVDVSSESETETWYGTPPAASVKEEIVYGMPSSSSGDTTDSDNRTVVKIHPSKLISIPSSETALESDWEPGRSKFTLYRIEYDIRIWPSVYKAVLDEKNQLQSTEEKEENPHNKKTIPYKRVIKRRYREFMELHSRLCSGPTAMYMKGILKPNRKYNLPFGRLDKEVVEGRRCLLQNYLVSLVSKPELRDCDDLKQFLGVIDGVSFIKPSVAQIVQSVHVPKMLSRQVTKVIDSIKTALEIEHQEGTEDTAKACPDTVDSSCHWTIVRHSSIDEQPLVDKEEVCAGDCFSAFLDTLELSTPYLTYHDTDTDNSYDDSSGNDDDDDDDDDLLHLLAPRTAGDTSDSPNEPSTASAVSQDDMLNGVLGSKSPGLCIPSTLTHSVSTGSLNEKDTIDFGKQWFQKDVHEKKPKPEVPERPPPPCPADELTDPTNDQQKSKFSHQLKFSKSNVEKLKLAAQKAKEKKVESMENLSHAKEKIKTLSKEKKIETVEQLSHAKDKVKAFSKETKFDSMEPFSHAKDKVKNFSRDKKAETVEHLSQAKEKVKSLSKDAKLEQLSHAKDKVKAFSKEKKIETMENLDQAKEKVKAFSKEKKIETVEHLSHAKDKVKAFSKEKGEESLENLHQVKDKVKAFQKKIPDSKKLRKKYASRSSPMGENKKDVYIQSIPVDTRKTTTRGHEKNFKYSTVNGGEIDIPSVTSSSDDPSCVTEVAGDMVVEEPQCPLSHAILDLTCEVLKGHDSWASIDRVQDGFLGIFGALFEWFVRSEIDDLFTEDNWGFYLENLIQVVWPDGKLFEPSGEQKSEEEKEKTKIKAIKTLMEFFPGQGLKYNRTSNNVCPDWYLFGQIFALLVILTSNIEPETRCGQVKINLTCHHDQ